METKQTRPGSLKGPIFSRKALILSSPDELQSREHYTRQLVSQVSFAGQTAERVHFEECQLKQVDLSYSQLSNLELLDVRCTDCNIANAQWSPAILQRVELLGCQITGLACIEAEIQDTHFKDCNGKFAQFRFSSFKHVCFENCDFSDADFQGADLTGATFINCNLKHVEMSGAKLAGVDLRSSQLDGMHVGLKELKGATINPPQAIALVQSQGIKVEWPTNSSKEQSL